MIAVSLEMSDEPYFYGESGNAIKIQIWVVLIANLLLSLLQRTTKRSWSYSGLATIVRITLMYYIKIATFLEHPEKDWEKSLEGAVRTAEIEQMDDPPDQ